MKITARLSIVIGLVLVFSFAGLSAAAVSGDQNAVPPADKNTAPPADKNTAQLDQQQMRGLDEQVQEVKSDALNISQ